MGSADGMRGDARLRHVSIDMITYTTASLSQEPHIALLRAAGRGQRRAAGTTWEGTERATARKVTPLPVHVQVCSTSDMVKRDKGALVPFHAQLGPFQVPMARFYM